MTTRPPRLSAHAYVLLLLGLAGIVLLAALSSPGRAVAAEPWTWPVDGEVLTTYLNGDDPYAAGQHRGIDVGAPVGSTVRAATAGTVTFAGTAASSGLTVSIATADGRFDTSYLHLESIDVSEGDKVDQGAELGAVGVSGRRSAETPHLHFGVRDAGERHAYRDPLLFLGAQGAPPPGPVPPPVAPPARPAPRPAPSPAPAPRSAPAPSSRPAPAPSLLPAPAPSPVMSPKGVPSGEPAPAPEAFPRPIPGAAPRRLERPEPRPGHAPSPAAHPVPARQPAPRPQRGPSGAHAPEPARGPESRALLPEADRRASGVPTAGPDLGWALACAGLGLAAAMLIVPRAVSRRAARAAARSRATAGPRTVSTGSRRPQAAAAVPRGPSSIESWPTTSRRPSTT